jgi:hypothetical protein
MRFFTPDLYLRFNSADDATADAADAEWEVAVAAYRTHLAALGGRMPSPIRKLAELNLHDADVLGWEEVVEPFGPRVGWSALAVLTVRQADVQSSVIYLLRDHVRECPPPPGWPFSADRTHWLFDEFDDTGRRGAFVHRILLSDGRVLEVPFISGTVSTLALAPTRAKTPPRRSVGKG